MTRWKLLSQLQDIFQFSCAVAVVGDAPFEFGVNDEASRSNDTIERCDCGDLCTVLVSAERGMRRAGAFGEGA